MFCISYWKEPSNGLYIACFWVISYGVFSTDRNLVDNISKSKVRWLKSLKYRKNGDLHLKLFFQTFLECYLCTINNLSLQ